jgi:poly-gamma-glutamate synthesis protein (capsule biosynthesis protein)
MLAGLGPQIRSADLAVCHLEVPLAPPGGPFSGYPAFSAPPSLADGLRQLGYDACSTASNHSLDKGFAGVRRTLDNLDRVGLRHAGMARSEREARTPTIVSVKGVRVALLSYSYGFNGIPLPQGRPYAANKLDAKRVITEAKAARSRGAEVVVASLHWGTEYNHRPNSQQLRIAAQLAESRTVDLVLGHHAHVVQPVDSVRGMWVAYGLGNSIAGASHNYAGGATREGLLARFTLSERPDGRFGVSRVGLVPTYTASPPLRVVDVNRALTQGAAGAERLRTARDRTTRIARQRLDAAERRVVR